MPRNQCAFVAIVALVGLLAVAGPVVGEPGQFFVFQPAPPYEVGDAARICVAAGVNSDGNGMEYGRASYNGSRDADNDSQIKIEDKLREVELDAEECLTLVFQETGMYYAMFRDAQLGNNERTAVFHVSDGPTQEVNQTSTTTMTTWGGLGENFPMLFWFTLTVLAFSQTWLFAGAIFLMAAIATQFSGPDWTQFGFEFGYLIGLAGVVVEILAAKWGPVRSIRERVAA